MHVSNNLGFSVYVRKYHVHQLVISRLPRYVYVSTYVPGWGTYYVPHMFVNWCKHVFCTWHKPAPNFVFIHKFKISPRRDAHSRINTAAINSIYHSRVTTRTITRRPAYCILYIFSHTHNMRPSTRCLVLTQPYVRATRCFCIARVMHLACRNININCNK